MEKDHGIRFTDEQYATKEDVKRFLNMSNIDSIWEKVNQYRSYYTKQTNLKNIERVPFCVVLPPKLTSKIILLEKRMSKLLIKYSKDSYQADRIALDFENDQYMNILSLIASDYEINIGKDTISMIVDETLPNIPVEYLILDHYYKTLKYFKSRSTGMMNLSVMMMMYTKLRGIAFDVTQLESYYRKNELIDRGDHVFIGRHYEASPVEKISDLMESLFNFINESPFCGTVNACITFFYINYVKPFEYYNEEMSILMAKYVLAHYDNEDIATFLPLEEFILKNKENSIKKMMLESEMKCDFTYLINLLIPYMDEMVDNLEVDLSSFDSLLIYQEAHQEDEKKKIILNSHETITTTPYQPSDVEGSSETSGLNFERKVALPIMPVGLDENDAELVAQHLLELYPTMKQNQAEFYAHHCTIGKYYTIGQYKKEVCCAYETARTSMDNLAQLGFYKKENIRNKFVYTPTPRD